jgi:hypothetical protein
MAATVNTTSVPCKPPKSCNKIMKEHWQYFDQTLAPTCSTYVWPAICGRETNGILFMNNFYAWQFIAVCYRGLPLKNIKSFKQDRCPVVVVEWVDMLEVLSNIFQNCV